MIRLSAWYFAPAVRVVAVVLLVLVAGLNSNLTRTVAAAPALAPVQPGVFVARDGTGFRLNGAPFSFLGANNYYLPNSSKTMADSLLATAASQSFGVVRTGGYFDIGNQDGSNSVGGVGSGVYFHYWAGGAPAFNDGVTGLQHLDYAIYRAGQLGVRLVIGLTNNWVNYGGMDQYVRWHGGGFHDDFYTDPTIRQWYKDYVGHLANRVNTYTGRRYREEPAILAWELANEPRCTGSGVENGGYPTSSTCTTTTLLNWITEMSAFVKSVDPNHLVGTGDEGFYCTPGASSWMEDCSTGVDTKAFTRVSSVDYMSFHLYAGYEAGQKIDWGTNWLRRHVADGHALGKPVVLGEFGYKTAGKRNEAYQTWTNAFAKAGGNGALFWMLTSTRDNGSRYPNYDGYAVYCPSPVCSTLSNAAQTMLNQ